MFALKQPKDAFNADCIVSSVKYKCRSVMNWKSYILKSASHVNSLGGIINSKGYLKYNR